MAEKVYIVIGTNEDYDCDFEWPVFATFDRKDADDYCALLRAEGRELLSLRRLAYRGDFNPGRDGDMARLDELIEKYSSDPRRPLSADPDDLDYRVEEVEIGFTQKPAMSAEDREEIDAVLKRFRDHSVRVIRPVVPMVLAGTVIDRMLSNGRILDAGIILGELMKARGPFPAKTEEEARQMLIHDPDAGSA
jgi:hypothetical protein